jgi:hypothetical protein
MSESIRVNQRPLVKRVIEILWPSFLTAGVATVLLFTWIDPQQLALCLYDAPVITRVEGYSLGFFALWLFAAVASGLTCYFSRTPGR